MSRTAVDVEDGAAQPAPWVLDVLLAAAVTLTISLIIASNAGGGTSSGWAYLWAIGLGAVLLLRRQHPVLVVVVTVVGVLAYHAAGNTPIGVALPLAAAVFSAASLGWTWVSAAGSAVILAVSVGYRLWDRQDAAFVVLYELPREAILLAGAIAFGYSVRSRRLLRRQAEEIARLTAERYARAADQRVLAERLALARDLHDTVGHSLTVIGLHTQVAQEALPTDESAVARALQTISDTTADTFADLRRTVAGLRSDEPAARSPRALSDLETAIAPARQAGLEVSVAVSVPTKLAQVVETAIYRVVQESVTNVVRHADARGVAVEIREEEEGSSVSVAVVNDVRRRPGREPSAANAPGNGIIGMRERVALLGGTFTAGPEDSGFAVRARIPLEVTS
ncbi:sensor histidine kinase [Microbacterium lushaniae]|nr:sensor histidine kinase [Microbacterium lushaniae]KAA9159114.1 sensor histidine kinase [Microbacterium lushaniae]